MLHFTADILFVPDVMGDDVKQMRVQTEQKSGQNIMEVKPILFQKTFGEIL